MKTIGKKLIAGAVSSALLLGMFPTAGFAANPDEATPSATQFGRQAAVTAAAATGFENGKSSLDIVQIARYDAGMTNADGGVMEIVDYNKTNGWAYAINGQTGKLAAIPLNGLQKADTVVSLDGSIIDVKALVNVEGFLYGDMTSVAVSPDGKLLAAAVQAENYAENGRVVLFQCEKDGILTFLKAIETGAQPDMVTFTPDGCKILTANEGEPREGYGEGITDPAGTVTIVDVAAETAQTIDFSSFSCEDLAAQNIVLKQDAEPALDLEPEYIAATNTKAYVTLQEANAIAVLDLEHNCFSGIYSAGFEDYSSVTVDIDKKDEVYQAKTYDSLRGIRMPDGISLYESNGKTYLLTANEGDAREWGDETAGTGHLNEDERNFGKGKTSPTGVITAENSGLEGKVVFFNNSGYNGLENDKDYLFGSRSFTMFEVTANGLKEVFDSGSDFEAKTAAYLPDYFNCSNDDLSIDDRSGKKGPEPETVVTGEVGDKTYAFVTQERIGGVMVYDITNPSSVSYVNYINSRDFSADVAGDDSPEGLKFIPASDSPTGEALLLAACEVGGTVAVYELAGADTDHNDSGDSSNSGSSSSSSDHTVVKPEYDTRIVLKIGSCNVNVDDATVSSDAAPVIVDGSTMVPLRIITETLGGTADWDGTNRTVTLHIDGKTLTMTIDKIIPGFDVTPVIIHDRTYVPIRYVAEALGATVQWAAETQQIIIEK